MNIRRNIHDSTIIPFFEKILSTIELLHSCQDLVRLLADIVNVKT